MATIAVFIAHTTIGNNPSIINLLDLLSDAYRVDLFCQHVTLKNAPVLQKRNIRVLDIGRSTALSYVRQKIRSYWSSYKHYICFDPHGFVLCKGLYPDSKPTYYSLELYMKDDHSGLLYPKHVMEKERSKIDSIKGLIIQSKERERFFREDYNLPTQIPSLLVPVTYKGPSVKQKSSRIREAYEIDTGKSIALHLGGIADWFSCIELAVTFSRLEDWILLFQGYPAREYLEELRSTIVSHNIKNVIISEAIYDFLEDLDPVVSSCDLGIAWYNDISIGFRTAGKCSGKIAAYLRFGLPVIAKKYPSTVDAIENTGCGICVDQFDEIKGAISQIEDSYDDYARNARREYNRTYWFRNYETKLIEFIECEP